MGGNVGGTREQGEICSLFDFPLDSFAGLWFRGQSCSQWALRPGVLRREQDFPSGLVLQAERAMLRRFGREAPRYLEPQLRQSRMELYLQAQHAGLPTRLLDWTTNPLAAIFFAVDEPDSDGCGGGALFALDIAHLDRVAREDDRRLVSAVDTLFRGAGKPSDPLNTRGAPVRPIAMEPNVRDGRMAQQSARFTFHFGADEWPEFALRRWSIPESGKRKIFEQLDALDVTRATLFPDLDNLARHTALWFDHDLRGMADLD